MCKIKLSTPAVPVWTWALGVVYTMDHEVVPRPSKICDWLLNLSWDYFNLYQGKNVNVIMEFKIPKRHMLRPTLSVDMVQGVYSGKGKIGAMVEKGKGPWPGNTIIIMM